jgi:DNA-binding transcriptional ArsR family regulator
MRALPDATRHAIVALYEQTPNCSEVGRQLGVDPRTVQKWVKRNEEDGNLAVLKGSGRPRLVSTAAAQVGKELILSKQYNNLHQVAVKLHCEGHTNKVVDPTTLSRRIHAQAWADGDPIVAKRGKPQKELTQKNKGKRLQFCHANKRRNWGLVMFTDRKKFHFSYPGSVVRQVEWVRRGEQRVASRPNHPQVVNMYAGIAKWGVTKPHLVTGTSKMTTNFKNQKGQDSRNITSAEYRAVLSKTLLPEGRRIFAQNGISGWLLQQDGDPTHQRAAREALGEWNNRHKGTVELLKDWPPNSPDLSPIENAWAYVQAKVEAAGCKSFDDFKATLEKEWRELDMKYLKSLIDSLPRRLKECVEKEGRKTHY